jgi:5-formyltetrahydrofolate cyclo-ligase
MPTAEVQTSFIVHDALKSGKRVFIPYCYKRSTPVVGQTGNVMDMLELRDVKDYESLKPDGWGIPTPSESSLSERRNCFGGFGKSEGQENLGREEDELDLVITPGLGFDRDLGRIGRGMGFYDSFFERCGRFSKEGKIPWKGNFMIAFVLNCAQANLQYSWSCAERANPPSGPDRAYGQDRSANRCADIG